MSAMHSRSRAADQCVPAGAGQPQPARRPLRASDESGIALIMALGVMMVLAVALGAVLELSASGARQSSRGSTSQTAYALAEAGINNAVSVIARGGAASAIATPTVTNLAGGTATWS